MSTAHQQETPFDCERLELCQATSGLYDGA